MTDRSASIHLVESMGAEDRALSEALNADGFQVVRYDLAGLARTRSAGRSPDAILLSLTGHDPGGLACCRNLRQQHPATTICLVHDGISEWEETVALEIGADVVIRRPVDARRIVAQIRALMRRSGLATTPRSRVKLNAGSRSVTVNGRSVALTDSEFELISILAATPGRVVTREAIYARLRGLAYDGFDRAIDLRICRIRNKLGDDPHRPAFIRSVRGEGYMLMVDED